MQIFYGKVYIPLLQDGGNKWSFETIDCGISLCVKFGLCLHLQFLNSVSMWNSNYMQNSSIETHIWDECWKYLGFPSISILYKYKFAQNTAFFFASLCFKVTTHAQRVDT